MKTFSHIQFLFFLSVLNLIPITVHASKKQERAEAACEKGKARKCERLTRKAAAEEYKEVTGDNKGARQMKKRDRKLRRAEAACNKGNQKKCDRLTRKAAKHDCLLEGGARSDCRKEKQEMKKDQKAFRKGFSDKNVTDSKLNELKDKRADQRDALGVGSGRYGDPAYKENGSDDSNGNSANENALNPQDDSELQDKLAKLKEEKMKECERRSGEWTGTICIDGRNPADVRSIPHPAYNEYQGNELMQQRGFNVPNDK